jgi:hypothetical protein
VGLTEAQDSLLLLSQERFVGMVLKYHPVIRQSELILETGEYRLKTARGSLILIYSLMKNSLKKRNISVFWEPV